MTKKHFTFYKIAAVLIALFMWGYVALLNNPTVEKIFTLPVEFTGLAEELVLINSDYQVQLRISGIEDVLDKLQTVDMHAVVDLENVAAGKHMANVDIQLPDNVQLVSRTPERIEVEIEARQTAAFAISVETGNPVLPEGYNAMDAIASPSIVYLTGAKQYLEQVDRVFVGINISGQSETYSQSLPVQVMDTQGNIVTSNFTITPSAVEVIVPIVADLPEKSVAVAVDYSGVPAEDYLLSRIVVEPSTVSIYGEMDVLDKILSVSTEKFDISGATSDIIETIDLQAPEGVSFGNTDKVTVIMQISHLETMRLYNIPIVVQNADEENIIELGSSSLTVTIKGLAAALAKFDAGNILASVDVKALKPGAYTLPVDIEFRFPQSSALSIVGGQPDEIRVTISEPPVPEEEETPPETEDENRPAE